MRLSVWASLCHSLADGSEHIVRPKDVVAVHDLQFNIIAAATIALMIFGTLRLTETLFIV